MDPKAYRTLSYGVFLLGAKAGEKKNACIINTCIQAASNPERVVISVLKNNYTCDLIKESGLFTVSVLDSTITYESIRYFGMQSGRDVDKLSDLPLPEDEQGVPYMGWGACAEFSCRVESAQDLGTHILFCGVVTDTQVLSDEEPLTYAEYHRSVKPAAPAPQAEKKIVGWRCRICRYMFEGSELPEDFVCPLCNHGKEDFEPVYEA